MVENTVRIAEKIEMDLQKMCGSAEQIMNQAILALQEQDLELARKVLEADDVIDNLQIVVEEELERAATQVVQSSFEVRRNFAMLKIAADLERIADYATNIAEVVLELKKEPLIKPLIHIPQLASLTKNMMTTVLKAFLEKNVDLAEAVCRKDEEADNLYTEITGELLKILGAEANPAKVYQASRLILIAEWLERAADHTTNIGEETIYIVTGKRVKY